MKEISRENEFVQLGHIHQTHGLNGEVLVSFSDKTPLRPLFKKGNFCFIEIKNQTFIPYKIISSKLSNTSSAIAVFDTFETIDKAKAITGKRIFFHKDQIPKSFQTQYKEMWIDYEIIQTSDNTSIGIVHSILQTPGQTLAEIRRKDREILIPLNEDWIVSIDHNLKSILMNIPEGLLEL